MIILKRMKTFFSFERRTKLLFVEALIYLAWARFLVYLPFSRISPYLGDHMQETSMTLIQTNEALLKNISYTIQIMARHTFWESKCLVKAIAGMNMLKRRQIESTIYLGMAKDEKGELIAHAWLRSGPYYITGAEVMNGFTVVGKFAKRNGDK